MARGCNTDGYAHSTIDQAAHTELVVFSGYLYDDGGPSEHGNLGFFEWGLWPLFGWSGPYNWYTGETGFKDYSGDFHFAYAPGQVYALMVLQAPLECDRTHVMKARAYFGDAPAEYKSGSISTFKTNAVTATSSTPTSSLVTSVTARIACNYYPNTYESTCTVKLQYKRSIDPGWTDAGAADAGISGYALQSITRDISGLTPSTQYDVRLYIVRTTNNETTFTSATAQFTTLAGAPTIETKAATGLSSTGATLNGTVNPNSVATTYYFDWGLTTAYGSTTAVQGPDAGAVPIDFNASLAGLLTPNSQYHFRAHAVQGGLDYYGADMGFSTDTQGHIMPTVYQHFAKYGEATDFYFCVETPAATGSDRFLNAAVPWIAGDVKIDKDGGGVANVTALPTRIGATALYKWAATAAEMQARKINVLLIDADGPAWRDCHIAIETKLLLGQIDVDATQIGGNVHAMSLIGVGSGYGLFAKGSSGIWGEAQGTSGFGILGKGIGGGQGVAAGHATLANAAYTNLLQQLEGTQPSGLPADNAEFGKILQYLKRRETNKVTQDSTKQIWYRDDSVTILCQRTVSDDLVTQVQNKLTS